MPFLSLYRKYRPRNFNDLIGQEYVVQTLRNALKNERIAHAYLFAGPRGTGKTSTAKVFAQALNCKERTSLEPCGKCSTCQNIQSGQSMDVIEIDAASNRGIDEIRELREKVKFYPGEGDYKVYIIDEVHMLTKGAFNALLKTLEEPPSNVVFILATTEPHQVISTILSRCQRFDFSLLSIKNIHQRLAYICKEEEIKFEEDALNLIAHASDGGLRDGISILDQAISYTDGNLTADLVQKMLGRIDKRVLSQFIDYIENNNSEKALLLVNDLIDKGKEVSRLISDLIEHSRQLLLVKECGIDAGILEYSRERLKLMEEESQHISKENLTRIIEVLNEIDKDLKFSNQPRLLLEVGIVKLTTPVVDDSRMNLTIKTMEDLETRVNYLEKKLQNLQNQPVVTQITGEHEEKQSVEKNEEKSKSKSQSSDPGMQKSEQGSVKKQDIQQNEASETKKNNEISISLDQVRKKWPAILSQIKEEDDVTTHAFLIEGKPHQVEEDVIYIQFPPDKTFHKKRAEQKLSVIERVFNQVLTVNCQVRFVVLGEEKVEEAEETITTDESSSHKHLVREIADMFEGQIIKANEEALEN